MTEPEIIRLIERAGFEAAQRDTLYSIVEKGEKEDQMTLTVHRARWIMVDPEHWIENGAIVMMGNRIQEVLNNIPKSVDGPVMDHGSGVLMPALVNAHTHISLSGHARTRTSEGFAKWVEALIAERNAQPCEEAVRTVQDGAKALKSSGDGSGG